MKMQQIRAVAAEHGIKEGKLGKLELVRAIQRAEGHFDCFATAWDGVCDQYGCLWREDCFELAAPRVQAAEEVVPETKKVPKPRKTAIKDDAVKKTPAKKDVSTKSPGKDKIAVKKLSTKTGKKKNDDKAATPAKRKTKTIKD